MKLRNNLQEAIEKFSLLDQSVAIIKKESEARRLRINELEVEIVNHKQHINHMLQETQYIEETKQTFNARL